MQIQSAFPNSQEEDENSKMRVKQIHKLESSKWNQFAPIFKNEWLIQMRIKMI